ncbi:archaea-specific SMC-related protein [Natronorubrum daqingense]|uniref:AAA domain-containing protein n=1 Tax=Natronorubrum daqingense TaxID=588898 RepID=A0A1N7EUK7_9EURY|nr:archaea-specific SMC-related protein [Natronorubrum daqingense]APX97707.1 chromosome segregation protein SMC [Natronorubrum daqingense]SIR91752.1 AAA domain-containing protein [Natronorubrum daqingense]
MVTNSLETQSLSLEASNVGGIDETSVRLSPDVTVLSGRNATNRTSLLQAIMAVLGSDNVSVKADSSTAHVSLSIDEETYTRTITTENGTRQTGGDPYLEDSTLADLFAFLLESNDIRRAVTTEQDLRELIMEPVDTDEIEAETERLVQNRAEIADELEELTSLKQRLPSLEEQRTELRDEIDSTEAELADLEAQLDDHDADVTETRAEKNEVEQLLADLREKRSSLEDVRYTLETEKRSLTSLRSERSELEAELEDLPAPTTSTRSELESEISSLRERKQRLESEISDVQSVVRFNEDMLDGNTPSLLTDTRSGDDDPVTDALVSEETVTCWTCHSEVEVDQIETTAEILRDRCQENLDVVGDLKSEIAKLRDEKADLEETAQRRTQLERRIDELEDEIEETDEQTDDLATERDDLREEIASLEDEIESKEDESYDAILEIHREANQLEYDLGSLESDLERVEDEIESIESKLRREDDLEAEHARLKDEIEELRMTVERIEQQVIDEFNEHMDTVLELLDYRNLERIWLERAETDVRDGRQIVTKSTFTLHVIRQTESGTAYEDTVEHLSESEREITGLILGLAGYLAHDVYETVPFVLLDSLEAIDAERIATLIDYLTEYSPSLVVALLEEDAAALDDEYRYVSEI